VEANHLQNVGGEFRAERICEFGQTLIEKIVYKVWECFEGLEEAADSEAKNQFRGDFDESIIKLKKRPVD
jgi:hypothetical protein